MKRIRKVWILMASVALYILSVGPVIGVLVARGAENNNGPLCEAVVVFYSPLTLISDHIPPLSKAFQWYIGVFCPGNGSDTNEDEGDN